ncbi:MAG: polyprenyl diphosphate synthase [Thermoplasmata archaeon]
MPREDLFKFFKDRTYDAYEHALKNKIMQSNMPKHMAIIMDGNRRFANMLNISIHEGHLKGKDKLEEVLNWCLEFDIKILTIYALSSENLKRNANELNDLMTLFKENFYKLAEDERVHKYGIKLMVIGNINVLPKDVQKAINYALEKTNNYSNYLYNIAISYGGRQEIVEAIKKIAMSVKEGKLNVDEINENTVKNFLYTSNLPDPDIILRTSGEERISNFLLWQMAYSELYFIDVYWPEFSKLDFMRAIYEYQKRQRRFGQ